MKLRRETYVHNRLVFEEEEETVLRLAENIVSKVYDVNRHGDCAEDTYLNNVCNTIMEGIAELLNNYSNKYPAGDDS